MPFTVSVQNKLNFFSRFSETWSGKVPCCDLKCPPHAKVDLYFLLDSSSSVGEANWKILVNFTIALVGDWIIIAVLELFY